MYIQIYTPSGKGAQHDVLTLHNVKILLIYECIYKYTHLEGREGQHGV